MSNFTEIAYAERTTTLSLDPANGLTLGYVPFDSGQEILVPRLNRVCWLWGCAIVDLDTAVLDACTELAIARNRTDPEILVSEVVGASHGPGNGSGSTVHVRYRIAPFTAGARYYLYAGSSNGAPITLNSPAHAPASLVALY